MIPSERAGFIVPQNCWDLLHAHTTKLCTVIKLYTQKNFLHGGPQILTCDLFAVASFFCLLFMWLEGIFWIRAYSSVGTPLECSRMCLCLLCDSLHWPTCFMRTQHVYCWHSETYVGLHIITTAVAGYQGYIHIYLDYVITLRASCGAVYCNRSYLWVCVFCGFVCGSVTTITRNCVRRFVGKGSSSWLNFGRPAPPGRGSAAGRKFLAPPYTTASAQCLRLSERFFSLGLGHLIMSLVAFLCILIAVWYEAGDNLTAHLCT